MDVSGRPEGRVDSLISGSWSLGGLSLRGIFLVGADLCQKTQGDVLVSNSDF